MTYISNEKNLMTRNLLARKKYDNKLICSTYVSCENRNNLFLKYP
jgi:hypothetical protein